MRHEELKELIVEILKKKEIVKTDKKYNQIKHKEEELKEYFMDNFSYELLSQNGMIKLERIPDRLNSGMGIKEFSKIEHYIIFALILDFLEEIEPGRTILISDILSYVVDNYPEKVDWKNYYQNLNLIKVLRFCQEKKLLILLDGSEDEFLKNLGEEIEVLYENSGISRNYMRVLPIVIEDLKEWRDYIGLNRNKELESSIKRARRALINSTIVKKDDLAYNDIVEHREMLSEEFDLYFSSDLVITTEFAYLQMDENEKSFSEVFPNIKNITTVTLLFCKEIVKKEKMEWNIEELEELSKKVLTKYSEMISKENLRKESKELMSDIIKQLDELNFINRLEGKIIFNRIVEHIETRIDEEEINDESMENK